MVNNFEDSWERWKVEYGKYRHGYNKDIWADIGKHPLDKIIDSFAMMYQESSIAKRPILEEALLRRFIEPWDLALYIRRVGLRLAVDKNEKLITFALLMATISRKHVDPRDLIVSLILMAVGAQKANMRMDSHLDFAELTADREAQDLLNNALRQSEASIKITIKMFGPMEWRSNI